MIKQTFYNLPASKRDRVISAVIDEFANTESDRVSINNIVIKANISRGSFYQYFDDKLDLVEVLIRAYIDRIIDDVHRAIAASDGDIFYTFECLFDLVAGFSEDERDKAVLKNIISNVRANNNLVSDYIVKRYEGMDKLIGATADFSRKGFRFKSDDDMLFLQQILTSVIKNEMYNFYVYETDYDATKERYLRKLTIIKQGAVK